MMKRHEKPHFSAARPAFTLVELMTSLVIFSIVASAAMYLIGASARTQVYVNNHTTAVAQAELAFRRIVENIRSASASTLVGSGEIDIVTQPDTSVSGNPVYNVKYYLLGSQLMESDDRYGTNVIAENVSAFTVTTLQATKPTMYQITLTTTPAQSEPITRQARVASRNF